MQTKAKVTHIDTIASRYIYSVCLKSIRKHNISPPLVPIVEQSFKVAVGPDVFFIVSASHSSPNTDPPTCAMVLVDNAKVVLSLVNTVGPSDELRPWTCDGTKAISLLDYYDDGSLKIVALYDATAPSGESFTVPVILRLDLGGRSLKIDEGLTKMFDEVEVNSISAVRAIINRQR